MNESCPSIDISKLVSCLRKAYVEQTVIEDYIGGMFKSRADVATGREIRKVLGEWVEEGFIDKEYQPTLSNRIETSYKPGRYWEKLLAEVQGINKKRQHEN
jgi:hypothetical protein